MQVMSLQQLAQVVNGRHVGENVNFNAISTDTRSIKKGELFVALQGENFDANDFVIKAHERGAVAALVSENIVVDMPYVKVKNTLVALTALAKDQREKTNIPVVAITGSNGKTSVKEMLASILSLSNKVLATKGNLNNQIGVPLTLLRLNKQHKLAVIEMGASKRGDIAELCDIAKPTIAILNNIGAAHLEGFGDIQGVATAKAEIINGLSDEGTAVLNADEPWFEQWLDLLGDKKLISFGGSDAADVWADAGQAEMIFDEGEFSTRFTLHYQQKKVEIKLNLLGKHNVMNALAASSAAISLGVSLDEIRVGLAAMTAVKGRMQPLKGIAGGVIINDCYNANPKSFEAAMACLADATNPVWLVLGDFAELGSESEHIHQQLGEQVYNSGVQRLYAVGDNMKFAVNAFNRLVNSIDQSAKHFSSKQELVDDLQNELTDEVVVLVKGSRSQGLESVVEKITLKEGGVCC
jgi:UDP-N-acetylmuramoyl-tripeptide--D-alanyl-D-alanine ligase